MMLHRHFEAESSPNMTKLSDVSEEYVSEVFPPETPAEAPKKRRQKKTTE